MSHVYLLEDSERKVWLVKIGKTSNTLEELETRYNTYIPNLKIHMYQKCSNAEEVEAKILEKYSGCLAENNKNNNTEWINYIPFRTEYYCIQPTIEELKEDIRSLMVV